MSEEWFTLDDIIPSDNDDKLYCISVDSESKQFLVGDICVPSHNTDEGKADDALKGEAQQIISSIARLGRAAGVHLVIATQRPDATLLPGETKANLGVRINCGRTDSNASGMILGNGEGTRVRSNPRGRLYLRIFGDGDHGQGFFADPTWIDSWLENKGLNPDGSPKPGAVMAQNRQVQEDSENEEKENLEEYSETSHNDLDIISEDASNTPNGEEDDDYNDVDLEKIAQEFQDMYGSSDDRSEEETNSDNEIDEEDEEEKDPEEETPTDRPILNGTDTSGPSKWDRPEDDWDDELEDLINENNR